MKKKIPHYQKNALLAGGIILLLLTGSITALLALPRLQADSGSLTAHIYQDGKLLCDIDLSHVTNNYRFTVTGADGSFNIIEVRPGAPGSIGITEASCPDKLCVHMGFQTSSLLPVICLPNNLVICITNSGSPATDHPPPDGITY